MGRQEPPLQAHASAAPRQALRVQVSLAACQRRRGRLPEAVKIDFLKTSNFEPRRSRAKQSAPELPHGSLLSENEVQ